jgi:hypothetical protein
MINRRKFLELSGIASTAMLLPLEGCQKAMFPNKIVSNVVTSGGIIISKCYTQKGYYLINEIVNISFDVTNTTSSSITLTEIRVYLKDISNLGATFTLTVTIANNVTIAAGGKYSVVNAAIWTVPSYALQDAYGAYIGATFQNGSTFTNSYLTFFRVMDQTKLNTYKITNSTYNGLSIQALDGGLSAEYAVGKAAEVLSDGVAHSWFTSASGSGPNSVYSTSNFLDLAVNTTVNYYNQTFGATTAFNTVVISTGVASIPYLSRVMKAPVLPLHFLVSANTVKEIIAILSFNSELKNYSSYCTLGYDGSITMAVAWIKLLAIPQQYIDFLTQHQVQNIVFAGTYGANGGGENTAKKIVYNNNPNTGYNNGDLFLMFPGGGTSSDLTNLYNKIVDLHDYDNQIETNYRQISDWESGLVDEQINSFVSSIKSKTSVINIRRISAPDSLTMYNLATYLTLTFMKKNQTIFTASGPAVLGVVMNPYLLAHPTYETKIQYIPMLFWQGNSGSSGVTRLVNQIQQNISTYFPTVNFTGLNFWINTSQNFGGYQAASIQSALQAQGLTNITMNDNTKDEVWNSADGMNAICEKVATAITKYSSPSAYKTWDNSLTILNAADLDALATRHTDITVVIL